MAFVMAGRQSNNCILLQSKTCDEAKLIIASNCRSLKESSPSRYLSLIMASQRKSFGTTVRELCKSLSCLTSQDIPVTCCLCSPQLAGGTEQAAQCQSTRPFSCVARVVKSLATRDAGMTIINIYI